MLAVPMARKTSAPTPAGTPDPLAELTERAALRRELTERTAQLQEALEQQAAKVPLGRMATEAEIAAVIVFLCSEPASNVVGAAWSVDGGSVQVII